jgi:uncharacterized protein YjbI with pentapeptide repeats
MKHALRSLFALLMASWFAGGTVMADIYEWEYVNPADPSQGKQQGTTLVPDGAGVNAVPGAQLSERNLSKGYFIGLDLHGVAMRYGVLSNADFTAANLTDANFERSEVVNVTFAGADLSGAVFNGTLTGSDFSEAIIKGAEFRASPVGGISVTQLYSTASYQSGDLAGTIFSRNQLNGVNLADLVLSSAGFYEASLVGANFQRAVLDRSSFSASNVTNADFSDANLYRAYLEGATAMNAFFIRSDMSYVYGIGANMRASDFTGAKFFEADLRGATLAEADFTNADMAYADFSRAILTDANFSGAHIQYADFSRTTEPYLTAEQLYATASYTSGDLTGVRLGNQNVSQWNFVGQNLSNAVMGVTGIETDFREVVAVGAIFANADLKSTRFDQADLTDTSFRRAKLNDANLSDATIVDADFREADLSGANLQGATLAKTDFAGANLTAASFANAKIAGARLNNATQTGFTAAQLYSTASYQNHDLQYMWLSGNDLSNWDFSHQDLTGSYMSSAVLAGADFTGAIVRDVQLSGATATGFTAAQFYSTASYQTKDLQGVHLSGNDLQGWNFDDQNLTGASLGGANLSTAQFQSANLTAARLGNANLTNADLQNSNLSQANMRGTNLSGAVLSGAVLDGAKFDNNSQFAGANLTDAKIQGASLLYATSQGFTSAQLYSTASYKMKDLSRVGLGNNNLSGWNFVGMDLTGASLGNSNVTGADFSGAIIAGAGFDYLTNTLTANQFYATLSYQMKELPAISLGLNNLSGWDFSGQNLAWSFFNHSTQVGTDFSGADLRGSQGVRLFEAIVTNAIQQNGVIATLDLAGGRSLLVRDHDAHTRNSYTGAPIPITVQDAMIMDTSSVLQLRIESDEWNSTISFEAGIPVTLDGTLELTFAEDVNIANQIGRTLDLFDWTGVTPTGSFDVSSLYEWDLTHLYTTGEVTLISVAELPGDFDGDGDVDGRDLLALQRNPNLGSFAAWQANYGGSLNSLSTFVAVPEPASAAILLSVAGLVLVRPARLRCATPRG